MLSYLLDDLVDGGVGRHRAVVAHVHEEAQTASEEADGDAPPVGAGLGEEDGKEQVEEHSQRDLEESNRLVEVAAPTDLLELRLHARAHGDEELVIRDRGLKLGAGARERAGQGRAKSGGERKGGGEKQRAKAGEVLKEEYVRDKSTKRDTITGNR